MTDESKEMMNETESQTSDASTQTAPTAGVNQEQYDELNNRYLRLAADFENFRKRQAQERESLFKYGAQSTLESLLPVLDNLTRGTQSLSENSDPKMLYKSFEMLSQQLLEALRDVGLQKLSPKGDLFDPEKHEAVSQVPNVDVPEYTILDVYQYGYMLHDRIIRPAQVVVAVQPEDQAASGTGFTPQTGEQNNPFQQASSGKGNA